MPDTPAVMQEADVDVRFPDSIQVKDLVKHSPEYDDCQLEKYRILYDAGQQFRENISLFLVKRPIEKVNENGLATVANSHYDARKEKAWYIPRASGLIDWLVAAVFKNDLKIVAEKDPDGFWEGLNTDTDGLSTTFASVARRVLHDSLMFGRGYFSLSFPNRYSVAADADTQTAYIKAMSALAVDDWEFDAEDNLSWVRTWSKSLARPNPWTPADTEVNAWQYITPTQVVDYQYRRLLDREPFDSSKFASQTSALPHQFGALPIFPVRANNEIHVMARIYDPLVALFNREVSVTFSLDQLAYALLVLKLDTTQIKQVVAPELGALRLAITEDAKFIAPQSTTFDPLFRDCDRLKEALYEVIHCLALNAAATQTQNARQSGKAKQIDRDPLQTLLYSFAWPIRAAAQNMVDRLKEYRGEDDNEVTVEGGEGQDATMDDLQDQIDQMAVPGTDNPAGDDSDETENDTLAKKPVTDGDNDN